MGSQSEGPLMVIWDVDTPGNRTNSQNAFSQTDPRLRGVLFDPESLTAIKIGSFGFDGSANYRGPALVSKDKFWFVPHPHLIHIAGMNPQFAFQIRASAPGDLFTVTTWNGSALISVWGSKSNRSLHAYHRFQGNTPLIPAPDGRRVFAGSNRIIRLDASGAVETESQLPSQPGASFATGTWPTEDPAYVVRTEFDPRQQTSSTSVLLPTSEVLQKTVLRNPDGGNRPFGASMTGNLQRGGPLLFPEYELLVLIPEGADRLLFRKIALRDALGQVDHPVVVSPSDLFATRGQAFSHQVRALSKAGGLTFSLVKGFAPAALSVSNTGLVTWMVPVKPPSRTARCIVKVKDAAGSEASHRLDILIR
jgi:hypothetical protein